MRNPRTTDDAEKLSHAKKRAAGALLYSWGTAALLTLLTVILGLSGWLWYSIRAFVGAVFTVALVAWLVRWLQSRRER